MIFQEELTSFFTSLVAFVQSFSLDVIIILGTFLALVFFAFQYGKDRIIALILSLYVALLVYLNFPYTEKFIFFSATETQVILSNVLIYLIFLALVFIIVRRVVLADFPSDLFHRWFEVLVLAAVATALLLAFFYQALPTTSLYDFSPDIDRFFETSEFFFWWLVAPFIALFFVVRNY